MNCISLNGLDITEIINSLSSRDTRFHYTNAPEQSKGAVIDGIMFVELSRPHITLFKWCNASDQIL